MSSPPPTALYDVIFPGESEAAFSNYRLWESLGFIFAYVNSTTSCMNVRVTNVVVWLVFGILGYYIIEILERRGGLKKDEHGNTVPIDRLVMDKVQ